MPGAASYLVSFNTGADGTGEYTAETKEPYILFQEMGTADTYYVWIQAKRGSEVSPILPNPLVIEGERMSSAGIVLHGIPAGEKPEPDTPSAADDCQPFDIKALAAERAAWESQKLTHYRFTRTLNSYQPEPEYSITVIPGREPLMVPSDEHFQGAMNPAVGRYPELASIDAIYAYLLEY